MTDVRTTFESTPGAGGVVSVLTRPTHATDSAGSPLSPASLPWPWAWSPSR